MPWLLDTNAWIVLLKSTNEHLVRRLAQKQDGDILLCAVVKAELWHGAHKYGNRQARLSRLQQLFSRHHSLPFDDDAAWHYAEIRHGLEINGRPVGGPAIRRNYPRALSWCRRSQSPSPVMRDR